MQSMCDENNKKPFSFIKRGWKVSEMINEQPLRYSKREQLTDVQTDKGDYLIG